MDEAGAALDGPGVYVSRYADDGTIEFTFETTTSMGTRVGAAPAVPLETLIAETEVSASPVP